MRPEGAREAGDPLQGLAANEQGTPRVRQLVRSSSLEGSSWSEAEWWKNRVRSISPNTAENDGNRLAATSALMQGWFIDPETVMEEREMRHTVSSSTGEDEQQAGRRETHVGL